MKELDLNGSWQLKPVSRFDGSYGDEGWLSQELPSHWQELPELSNYAGKVVYRRKFSFSPQKNRRYFIRFNGVFYYFCAYLNGCRLGANQGYFFPVEFEITEILEEKNELLVEVDCEDEKDKSNKWQLTGVFHHWDCIDPKTNPGGIWNSVEIYSTGAISIKKNQIETIYFTTDYARLVLKISLDSRESEEVSLKFRLLPANFDGEPVEWEKEVYKGAGTKEYQFWLDLKDYKLWWTYDIGKPNLYFFKVEAYSKREKEISDSYETKIGIRTFALRNYTAYLNGKRIFLRGENYPPADTRLARATKERYQKDIELVRDANINILRVHAHIEKKEFYEVCDEQGILVWQDFPLQWYYRKDVLSEALFQVSKMVEFLFNHPSVVIWCMHNEPMKVIDLHKKIKVLDVLRMVFTMYFYSWNREVMDKKLLERVKFLDPFRPSLQCSGERGILRKDRGDSHLYFGWYVGSMRLLDYFVKKKPERLKLVSEFGAQSFPNYSSSIKFMAKELENVDFKHLKERHHLQPWALNRYVNRKKYSALEDYIQATQLYQSELNRYYIDRLRYLKYKPCGGAIAFIFTDSNPAVQWSVVDYYRQPKSSYYELKKAFSPVYAFTLIQRRKYKVGENIPINVYAVNDKHEKVSTEIELSIFSPIGARVLEERYEIELEPDCEATLVKEHKLALTFPGEYKIELTFRNGEERLKNVYVVRVRD